MTIRKLSENKYQIDFYPRGEKGKRERVTFVGCLQDARKHEMELRQQYGTGIGPDPAFADLIPDFLVHYKGESAAGTYDEFVRIYTLHLEPHFGAHKVSRFSSTLIEQYKNKRLAAGVKKKTINKELAYLSSVFTWASDPDNGHCQPLPFKIKRYAPKATKSPLPVVPSLDEVTRWLAKIRHPYQRGLFLLMYDGGLRRTEAATIRSVNVDLENNLLIITGKGNKERLVPILTERLKEELAARVEDVRKPENKKANKEGYLYFNPKSKKPYGNIRDGLKTAAVKAGITKRVYNHLLRHSFGTHSTVAGVHQRSLQKMFGHAALSQTEIYSTLAAETIKAEGAKFAALVGSGHKTQPVIDTEADE